MSSGDAAGLIIASGGFIAVLGKGVAWLWKQRRNRISELERRMDKIQSECANERLESTRKIDCLVTVCIVLIDGGPHATIRAKHILGGEFPDLLRRVYPAEDFADIDPDMQELAQRATDALRTPRRRRPR